MAAYSTPGVYFERADTSAPVISAVRTDVTGFVGIAQRGPLDTAIPVESWRQFQAYFGGFIGSGFLAYAVRGFFENGGRRCWVARVASRDAVKSAEVTLKSQSGKDVWRIAASSPGVWGNDLSITLTETHRAQTMTDPKKSNPNASVVSSITGFARGTHVRLTQGTTTQWKVVSDVDAGEKRLIWVHEKPAGGLPYDAPLTAFDLNQPILIESVEYTLVVRESGKPIAVYEDLSLIPEHAKYGPCVLAAIIVSDAFGMQSKLPAAPNPVLVEERRQIADNASLVFPIKLDAGTSLEQALKGGSDGLSLLQVFDFIGEEALPSDSDELKANKCRGIRAFDSISDVSIVAVPDIHVQPTPVAAKAPIKPCTPDPCLPQETVPPALPAPPPEVELPPVFTESDIYQVQSALVRHCEEHRDRIALLDPPLGVAKNAELAFAAAQAWRSRFDSKYAAFYYPWIRVVDPLGSVSLTRDIPPSGHVAGQYARTDFEIGVHKAPANVPLTWIQDVTITVNDAVHGIFNPLGINVIRPLAGRGIRILGGRTISSDPDWIYVNVRRLIMMIEKAIDLSTQWAAFEPNDAYTRAKLSLSIKSFLTALWQKGALVGGTAEEAFFVKCDEENNPPSERANGKLLAEVGIAPSRPFEFIVLRVGRTENELQITESSPMQMRGA